MAIIYVLFAFFVLLTLYDFKKGVLLFMPFKLFFGMNVRLLPSMTVDFAFRLFAISLFGLRRHLFVKEKFPLKKCFVIYSVFYVLNCLYPDMALNYIPRIVISVLCFSYVYYCCLQNRKDIYFAVYSYLFFIVLLCGNGLLGPLLGINPLDDYIQSISNEELSFFSDNDLVRFGRERYRSFIPHAISYGVLCVTLLYLLVWYLLKVAHSGKAWIIMGTCLLLSGVVICTSRTPILGLFPFVIIFRDMKVSFRKIRPFLLILVCFLLLQGDYILYLLESVFTSNVADDAGGSSTEMRMVQFSIALRFFLQSPLFGQGMEFNPTLFYNEFYGGESVWLPLLANQGMVGLTGYLFYNVCLYKMAQSSSGKNVLYALLLSWLIMRSATSLIGVTDATFLSVFFIIYKWYNIEQHATDNYCSRL